MPSVMDIAECIMQALPEDGRSITNGTARAFARRTYPALTQEEYFEARDYLMGLQWVGRRRGRGGTIYRRKAIARPPPPPATPDWAREENLYPAVSDFLRLSFGKIEGIDIGSEIMVFDVSTHWRADSGRWSVPDLVLIAQQSYVFFSGYDLDVITFEVKTETNLGDTPVFQSFSQSMNAHRGYLIWHCPAGRSRNEVPRLRTQCRNTGVGLIVLEDPLDHGTYEVLEFAQRRDPAKWAVDEFLSDRLTPEQAAELTQWLKEGGE